MKQTRSEQSSTTSQFEFTALMACIMSLAAMSTDIMIPGLSAMGHELKVSHANDIQLIVSVVFFGLAPGQLLFGPLADSIGRKQAMLIGIGLFLLGSVITVIAPTFEWLLAGRIVQGIGLGAPRTLTLAIIRDQHVGPEMARIMSNIMSVFACIPMIAPITGQLIQLYAGWRAIFGFVFCFGLLVAIWFYLRQAETLAASRRTPLSVATLGKAAMEVCSNRVVLMYAAASGFVFAGFVVYMSTAAQIFQQIYDTGAAFGFLFALTGLAMAIAAHVNGRWVRTIGVQRICYLALVAVIGISGLFAGWIALSGDKPGLVTVVIYLTVIMFIEGALYSNLYTLAMEPLDRNAGMGATLVSVLSMAVSVPLGMLCARLLTDSIFPLVASFLLFGCMSLLIVHFVEKRRPQISG